MRRAQCVEQACLSQFHYFSPTEGRTFNSLWQGRMARKNDCSVPIALHTLVDFSRWIVPLVAPVCCLGPAFQLHAGTQPARTYISAQPLYGHLWRTLSDSPHSFGVDQGEGCLCGNPPPSPNLWNALFSKACLAMALLHLRKTELLKWAFDFIFLSC